MADAKVDELQAMGDLAIASTQVDELQAQANDAAEAGDFEAAVALFRQAVSLEPRRADLLEPLAQCLLELDDAPGAVEAATAAARCEPTWAVAHQTLGRAQLNAGEFGGATKSFRQAIFLDGELQPEVQADLETAQRLKVAEDERELVMQNGVRLRIQQWRGDDGGGGQDGCGSCGSRAADPTPRHGTGTMIWECGIVLAGYLMRSQGVQLGGQRVLEIGSGTGVAGLAAAALGAQVVLTDLAPVTLLLRSNARLNREAVQSVGGVANVEVLDYSKAAAARVPAGGPFDYVLGADLVYQPDGRQLPGLVALLSTLLAPSEGRAGRPKLLLAHKSRKRDLDEKLLFQLRAAGIAMHEIPFAEHHPEYRTKYVRIFAGQVAA